MYEGLPGIVFVPSHASAVMRAIDTSCKNDTLDSEWLFYFVPFPPSWEIRQTNVRIRRVAFAWVMRYFSEDSLAKQGRIRR